MGYMVCDVQYGGRITDGLDTQLFQTYGQLWIQEPIFQQQYTFIHIPNFHHQYTIPDATEHVQYMKDIGDIPSKDTPQIFGLHLNADITFRKKESSEMLATLMETQPKDSAGGAGLSREDIVKEKIEKDLLPIIPNDFNFIEVDDKIKVLKGGNKSIVPDKQMNLMPLNLFLKQELERFQKILDIVRTMLIAMIDAIEGSTIMTPELVSAIDAVFDFRVPRKWQYDPTGAEISWMTPNLAGWIKGLTDRHYQLHSWVNKERPPSFWLTGFFNPQGFLTAMKQEVSRAKKGWALDEVEYDTEPTKEVIQSDDGRIDGMKLSHPQEGVYIHGLYIEGAGWNNGQKALDDSQPGKLYQSFPIMLVTAVYVPRNDKEKDKPAMGGRGGKMDVSEKRKKFYDCPVYKYPKRSDKYLVFRVLLRPEGQNYPNVTLLNKNMTPPIKWKLAGVSLLCSKE